MGKGWKGHSDGKKGNYQGHDFSSCRGFGVVLATCDGAKERETSRELVQLFNDAIERVYPDSLRTAEDPVTSTATTSETSNSMSISELMKQEILNVKDKKSVQNSTAVSIRTDVKGIALLKLLKPSYCPITLLKDVFEHLKAEKRAISKFTVRMIPLKYVFFPKEADFVENIERIFHLEFGIPFTPKKVTTESLSNSDHPTPDANDNEEAHDELSAVIGEKRGVELISNSDPETATTEGVTKQVKHDSPLPTLLNSSSDNNIESSNSAVPQRKFPYVIQFKARNHTVLQKAFVHEKIEQLLSNYGYPDYRRAEKIIMVEALKNLCGMSILSPQEYHDYEEFNIRKFQDKNCEGNATSSMKAPPAMTENEILEEN